LIIPTLVFALVGLLVGPLVNQAIDRFPPVPEGSEDRWIPTVRGTGRRIRVPSPTPDPFALVFVPIVGLIAFKGQGRSRTGFSYRRPIVDLLTAGLMALAWYQFEDDWFRAIAVSGFATAFLALAVMDFETQYLPDKLTLPSILIALAVSPFWSHLDPWDGIAGAAAGLAIFYPFVLYGQWKQIDVMALGDVKFSGFLGAVLGTQFLLTGLYMGVLTGGLAAIAILIRSGMGARKSLLPYGVFLSLGGLIALYFGRDIIDWASNTFIV
jgi:leader peptidase (prepilin peptidase)/N-methyltransferase